ncbi:MAG: hypothetical protein ITG00_09080 [Flavobacterium sp.]|nr:hypothetical protein [Flavobacterium sp.]
MNDLSDSHLDLQLNEVALKYLEEIAKWSRFLSVAGYIGLAFLLLLGLVSGIFLTSSADVVTGIFVIVFYSAFVSVYIFPVFYLYRFSTKVKNALQLSDSQELAESFGYLKSHYKFLAIASIIIISLYALMMFGAVIGGLADFVW